MARAGFQTMTRPAEKDTILPDLVPGKRWDDVLLPPLIAVGVIIIGWILHGCWNTGWYVWAFPTFFEAAGIGLGYGTWALHARPRDVITRITVAFAVWWGFSSTALTIAIGPWGGGAWISWQVAIDVVIMVSIAITRARAVKGEGRDGHGSRDALEALGLHPATTGRLVEQTDRSATVLVEHGGTQGTKDMQDSLGLIERLKRMRPGSLRATEGPVSGTSAVTYVFKDVMRDTIIPAPALEPIESCTKPMYVGQAEDGEDAFEFVTEANEISVGMNGSGKGNGEAFTAAQLAMTPDCVIWVSSPVKVWQTYSPVKAGIDWMVSTERESAAMIRALKAMIPARAALLESLGYRKWEPECWTKHHIPFIEVFFEEAAWMADADQVGLVAVAERSRSAGIRVRLDLQRASFDRVDTSLRAQIGAVRCYGVQALADAELILSDIVLESGARPDTWGNTQPGLLYLTGPGIPQARWTVPVRGCLPVGADGKEDWTAVREAVEAFSGRAILDRKTAEAAGTAYADRQRTNSGRTADGPHPQKPSAADGRRTRGGDETADERTAGPSAADETDPDEARFGDYESDLDEETQAMDPHKPIEQFEAAEGEDIEFDMGEIPGPKPTSEEMDIAFQEILQKFKSEERRTFDIGDFLDEWFLRPGFKRGGSIYRRLDAAMVDGQISRGDRGVYELLPEAGVSVITVADGDDDDGGEWAPDE